MVITYHSLEDRLVKNFMRSGNFTGKPEKDFLRTAPDALGTGRTQGDRSVRRRDRTEPAFAERQTAGRRKTLIVRKNRIPHDRRFYCIF